jgi:hypothetical protein
MKTLLALLSVLLLGLAAGACGGSTAGRTSTNAASSAHTHDRDDDNDHNDDDNHVLYYGREASPTDRQAIVTLLTRYYAAAGASDGAKACPLLMSFIAEALPENLGHSPTLRGKSCAVVISKLFKQHHKLLGGESATLKVMTVRVEGDKALTVLSFANLPEVRQMTERREGSGWKIVTLLDGIVE